MTATVASPAAVLAASSTSASGYNSGNGGASVSAGSGGYTSSNSGLSAGATGVATGSNGCGSAAPTSASNTVGGAGDAVAPSSGGSSGSPRIQGSGLGASGSSPRIQGGASSSTQPAKRPGGGLKWSEVCERVQQPDGSVRTSPPFKSGAVPTSAASAATATTSPPRPRPAGAGLVAAGKFDQKVALPSGSGASGGTTGAAPCSSRGGSSRGASSGKSSRSSSRDPHARDGDISSRCSSGGGWETSTTHSETSRPRTPEHLAPSPSSTTGLLMPDPIRTSLALPPALLDEDPGAPEGGKAECAGGSEKTGDAGFQQASTSAADENHFNAGQAQDNGVRVGALVLKWDPCGRDGPRRAEPKPNIEWSAEPLAKYITTVAAQIEANLQNSQLPTAEKLDSYVFKLVANTHRQMRHAPRKIKQILQSHCAKHFQRFWNFKQNNKLRTTTPEELRTALVGIVEALINEFGVNPDALAQQPRHSRSGHSDRRG